MPPKPPPRMSILLVVTVQNLPRFVFAESSPRRTGSGLLSTLLRPQVCRKFRQQVAVATMLSAATGPALAPFPHVCERLASCPIRRVESVARSRTRGRDKPTAEASLWTPRATAVILSGIYAMSLALRRMPSLLIRLRRVLGCSLRRRAARACGNVADLSIVRRRKRTDSSALTRDDVRAPK